MEPGLEYGPPVTNPEVWYSFNDNIGEPPLGTPCFEYYNGSGATSCPRLFPELGSGGVGPHGAAKYTYDPANPDTTKLPPYYDGAIFFGEFTRDTLREIRLDSEGRVFKLNDLFNCGGLTPGQVPQTDNPFECDSPMDMQFDESRALLPAHVRRRVLQHQQRRRDVPLGLRQGAARSDRRALGLTDRRSRAVDRAVLERGVPRPRPG